jgi:hypothetical protein
VGKILATDVRGFFKSESKYLASGTIPPTGGLIPEPTMIVDQAATLRQPPPPEVIEIVDRRQPAFADIATRESSLTGRPLVEKS